MKASPRNRLRTLARLMRRQNDLSFPITEALLDCFEWVIRPEEADFLIQMGTQPCTYAQAARLSELSESEFSRFFETLLKKGLVWPRRFSRLATEYALAPFMVGWFELQLCSGLETPDKIEFARRLQSLSEGWAKYNVFPLRHLQNLYFLKTGGPHQSIAANFGAPDSAAAIKIEVKHKICRSYDRVYPSDSVQQLVMALAGDANIARMHCFCRQWRKMVGEPCRFAYPPESCLTLGPITDYIVRYGFGRYISKREALDVIDAARKAGAVHTVFYERDNLRRPVIGICSCCWDCCGLLGSYNRGVLPIQFKSYYRAVVVAPQRCVNCGLCQTHCPVAAITHDDTCIRVAADRCIGCGQCAGRCPEAVIGLEPLEREVKLSLLKKSAVRLPSV